MNSATGTADIQAQIDANRPGDDGIMRAADGTPLKKSLARALRREKLRAFLLIAPLLAFIVFSFVIPIGSMLFRSVDNTIVPDTLPRTVEAIRDWSAADGTVPDDAVFTALYQDIFIAAEERRHTRLGSRLNYETSGMSSLFRGTGRDVDDFGEVYQDQFEDLNEAWEQPATWAAVLASPDWIAEAASADGPGPTFQLREGIEEMLPQTADAYATFANFAQTEDDENPLEEDPWSLVHWALYQDLANGTVAYDGPQAALVEEARAAISNFETVDLKAAFIESDEDWGALDTWRTIKQFNSTMTPGYFLAAVDMEQTANGFEMVPENERIYARLFGRTLWMSLLITSSCLLLGYPIAYLLAHLPARRSNLLMILVLLPFWTSLLVRTSAWKVLLQQQGVINDFFVWSGILDDANRLVMINNQTGTIIAMTHILLPFMILPLYSVMQTISPNYVRAAKSLGATDWTAFWKVYFPQSVPGIGAGSILVFILAIGYYITPALVGGTDGIFISNRIAYHVSQSLNWGLAAALGAILLLAVIILFYAYDKVVGIDNVKLG